jgi:hypothetical protein
METDESVSIDYITRTPAKGDERQQLIHQLVPDRAEAT